MGAHELPEVGTRISLSGFLGTIRFVGQVENTSGIWLGVEWDDPQRGKHDGVKDGKRYFTCLVPNTGSFIRPSAAISYGTSFLTALAAKYIELPRNSDALETVVLGSSHGAIEVEAVGLDKIRGKLSKLERLREVSLDNEGVSSADPPGVIQRTCPGIRGLDLSKNLIASWDVVAAIVAELPLVQRLALNQNRLRLPHDVPRAFAGLRELQLSATLTTWGEMHTVLACMPVLRLLEMGYNRLRTVFPGPPSNPELDTINLDSNELDDWRALCDALQSYPALRRVVLASNHVAAIPLPYGVASPVAHLKHVSLSFNRVAAWCGVDALPLWFPALESLTFAENPLVEDPVQGKNARQFIIAKIPTLLSLDAAAITPKERTDCELFYMSHIAKFGPTDEEEKVREHPQWKALCRKHGRPDNLPVTVQQRQDTLSNRLIGVNVCLKSEQPTSEAPQPMPLRVLPMMLVRALRMKIIKTLKIPKAQQPSVRLWLSLAHGELIELDREHDTNDLLWWGLEDGSTLVVGFAE